MSSQNEFGRELAFKTSATDMFIYNFINELNKKYKNMTWAEICYAQDEENQEKYKELAMERKKQLAAGNYELEDGEILE